MSRKQKISRKEINRIAKIKGEREQKVQRLVDLFYEELVESEKHPTDFDHLVQDSLGTLRIEVRKLEIKPK
ncbi:MAG: hypothetical protein HYX20_01450 [Candidatus Yanofskybacteria bacterium]|nr:hypothetical protein [Candidatus Yanofskybacteria bacterium]